MFDCQNTTDSDICIQSAEGDTFGSNKMWSAICGPNKQTEWVQPKLSIERLDHS